MKTSAAQLQIIQEMAKGAKLGWNNAQGCFELRDANSARTVQARSVDALSAVGLIQRDVVGDCMLTSRGAAVGSQRCQ